MCKSFLFLLSRNVLSKSIVMIILYIVSSITIRINDACKLLILPFGNAKLFSETIKSDIKAKSNSKEALSEHKLAHISNLLALDILERRKDICSF